MPIINMVYKKKKGWKPGDNTIAYYLFDNNANDSSGNGYNLTASGNVSYTTVNNNYVVHLQGTAQSNSTKLVSGNISFSSFPATYSIWVKTESNGTGDRFGNKYFLFQTFGTSPQFTRNGIGTGQQYMNNNYKIFYANDQRVDTSSAVDIGDGKFHHIVATMDTSALNLYVDGTKVYTGTSTSNYNFTGKIYIGGNDDNYYGFNGYVGETILENVVWSDALVGKYYLQTKAKYT